METEGGLSGRTRGEQAGERNGDSEKNPILHFIKPVRRGSGHQGWVATALRQFHLTRSAGNKRQKLDNLQGSSWYKEERRRDGRRQRRRVGEKRKKKSCSLERLNEVEMCPPQGFPGNYICSGAGFNRVGRRGGEYVQGAKGSLVKMQSGNRLNEPKMW